MTCDFYANKKASALFTRPSALSLDDGNLDLEAEDMMEMADLAYFSHAAFADDRACFDDMPEELVYLIFTFLHGSDIANGVQKVCRNWRRLALDDQVCEFIPSLSSSPRHLALRDMKCCEMDRARANRLPPPSSVCSFGSTC
jgi:hypothetical protein